MKVYFYDTGIRKAIVNNFNKLEQRTDSGHLFENNIVSEFYKQNSNTFQPSNLYFWRTYDQKKIDLVADKNGFLKDL